MIFLPILALAIFALHKHVAEPHHLDGAVGSTRIEFMLR